MKRGRVVPGSFAAASLCLASSTCQAPSLPCADASGCGGGGGEAPFHLSASVEIVRDQDGIVHIYGQADQDVVYGAGYMQASDRLYEMDLMRRRVYGRRAEVLGDGYKSDDSTIRAFDISTWGKKNAEALRDEDATAYGLVAAWTAGVNARIDEVLGGSADTPTGFTIAGFEPERWDVEDAFVIGKSIVFDNGNQLEFDLLASLIRKYQPDLFTALPFYSPIEDEFILGDTARSGSFHLPKDASGSTARHLDSAPALPPDARERLLEMHRRLAQIHPRASNNWAVSPELTDTGKSFVCGDPHQPLRSPSLMWMLHMNSADAGGNIDLAGWTFVGTPGVSLGQNAHLAWTATTNYPDVTDVWDIQVDGDPSSGETAIVAGEQVPVDVREEQVLVKDGDPIAIHVEVVPGYGVLLPTDLVPLPLVDLGHRLLFNWTGYRVTHEAQVFARFGQAKTLDDFDAAVDRMELGSFNFVAASADGITYRSSPIVPDRGDPAKHAPSYAMLDGSKKEDLWTGDLLPLDRMPHSRGGADGVIVTANNDPFGFTGDGSLTDDPYYFGAYFDPGLRASRIHHRLGELAAAGPITIDDMQALQLDSYSLLADNLLPDLTTAWSKVDTDDALTAFRNRPELEALMTLLTRWDRRMAHDEAAPVAFEAFSSYYAKLVIGDDLSLFFDPIYGNSAIYAMKFAVIAARDPSQALLQEGKDVLLLTALSSSAAFLQDRFGAVDSGFTWADFHETGFPSESIPELDGGAAATDGGEGTVNVSESQFFSGDDPVQKHRSTDGALYRMTATFDDDGTPRAFFTMAGGESGEPSSEHFQDFTDGWVNGDYRLLRFKREDVDAGAVETIQLDP